MSTQNGSRRKIPRKIQGGSPSEGDVPLTISFNHSYCVPDTELYIYKNKHKLALLHRYHKAIKLLYIYIYIKQRLYYSSEGRAVLWCLLESSGGRGGGDLRNDRPRDIADEPTCFPPYTNAF